MKKLFIFALVLISYCSQAQQSSKKDYFVDNEGTKTECYIDVKAWSRDPKSFKYQVDQKGEMLIGSVTNVKEFVVGEARYIRADVQIDDSSKHPDSIKTSTLPEWKNETLFLSLLVDGKADLFYCKRKGQDRFFYSIDENTPIQLVHKPFLIPKTATRAERIATNNEYRNQLRNAVNCLNYSAERLKSVHYEVGVLVKYFNKQNECWGGEIKSANVLEKRPVHITFKPGFSFADAESKAGRTIYEDYEPGIGFRAGVELQYPLPFYRKKLTLWLEPTWQSYAANGKTHQDRTVSYQSLELSFGLRHYFFLQKNISIFLDAAGVFDMPTEFLITFLGADNRLSTTSITAAVGAGVSYKRLSLAGRYYTTRTVEGRTTLDSGQILPLRCDYQKISVIVGYRLF